MPHLLKHWHPRQASIVVFNKRAYGGINKSALNNSFSNNICFIQSSACPEASVGSAVFSEGNKRWNRSITRIWGTTRRCDDAKEPGFADLLLTLISSRTNHICFSICQMLHLLWETCDITTPTNICLLKGMTGGDLIDERLGAWNSDVFCAPADGFLRWQRPLRDHTFRLNRHLFQRRPRPIAEHIVAVTPLASAGDWTLWLYCPAGFTCRLPWISLHRVAEMHRQLIGAPCSC